ncbi:MAG: mercury(II) reductase [Conexivisphaerales archaeon]
MSSKYDIVIIGRGAAAFSAAIKASELSDGKASIAMVGNGPLGGTCVNVGCVPSKYLLEASHAYFYSKAGRFRGVRTADPSLDFSEVMEGTRALVSSFRKEKYEKVLSSYSNVESIDGYAKFNSSESIEVSGKTIRYKSAIIATGSSPSIPPIEGLRDAGYITSNTVWQLSKKPDSIAVIGGGAIGLEIGQAFLHFGTQVAVIEAMPRIIPQVEGDISSTLQSKLEDEGMQFYTKARINTVSKGGNGKMVEIVTAKGRKTIKVEEILVATGRIPNTSDLGLDKAGVEADGKGFIKVNSGMRTTNPRIFAAGDCISKKLMLETLAAREGTIASINLLGGNAEIDYDSTPWAVFTNPQVASVGMTEEEFMKKTGACSCRVIELKDVPKAVMLGEPEGMVKLVVDPYSYKVVGLHILSPLATEFIIEGAYAIKYGLTFREIMDMTHIFPTLAEGIKLSAQAFVRDISKMSCCVE